MTYEQRIEADLLRVATELRSRLVLLRARHARLVAMREALFDDARDGIVLIRPEGAVANPSARTMLGLTSEPCPPGWTRRLTHPDGRALAPREEPWERAIAGEHVDEMPLAASGRPLSASARRAGSGAILVLHDVSVEAAELRAMQRSIIELDGMRRRSRALLAARRERRWS